ncbi:MAG TPA: FAD binding domain-containing protein [Blastocatellia bacterium]|nr:FAD binding domain-containing protein [Blastocatellia bacterium]
MRAFEYASPTTKEQAVGLLGSSWNDAEVLAGGTDLLALMKDDVVHPKRVVNIKEIAELREIKLATSPGARGGVRAGRRIENVTIGSLVTIQQLIDNADVRRRFPALIQAAEGITSPQIRSMGTVGGDLCQRPRCWYYRAGFGLLGTDEKGESLVTAGDNRYHAILGNDGPAYFVNPSSLAPALIAYDARVRIFGPKGAREVAAEKFFTIPQSNDAREYDLKPNEIVTEIIVPATSARSATYEVRQKEALDWPLAAASVALTMNGNKVTAARVVLGHVAPVPWRSTEAEEALVGKTITEETAKAAGDAAVSKAKALSRNGYKIQLARVAVKRAVLEAAKGGAR